MGANSFFSKLTPIKRGRNKENVRVVFLATVPIYHKVEDNSNKTKKVSFSYKLPTLGLNAFL